MDAFKIESDEEDNSGPPILSPQVETDEGYGKSILDFKFEDPVDFNSTSPSNSNSNKSSTASSEVKEYQRSHHRKISELTSILKKPSKCRKFTSTQYKALCATWEVTQYPPAADVLELMHTTGLTRRQIRGWFNNRNRLTRRGGNKANETDQSSSQSVNNGNPTLNYTKKEMREMRLGAIKHIPHSTLEECMEISRVRMSQLILLYMQKKLDMKQTLLRETTKLKERIAINPFSSNQVIAMKLWRDNFFLELCQELNEDKRQKMSWIKSNVAEVWHSVVLYGKLVKISLETAIADFIHPDGVERQSISDDFTVPGILRYTETHF